MSTPGPTPADPIPDRPTPPKRSNSIPFPSEVGEGEGEGEQRLRESASSSSALTSSDKLTALPTQSTPVLERLRTPSRPYRRGVDSSGSLTSIDSASSSLRGLQTLPGPIRQSESDSSVVKDGTPRQRNESERSLPATLRNIRQCEWILLHIFSSAPMATRRLAFLPNSSAHGHWNNAHIVGLGSGRVGDQSITSCIRSFLYVW
ncbi:hypothetical protein C8Q80DRAFT_1159571 [Daedaleopsis nitida]|nr:hypothetical protein C8Q80DRAFT_1159571 [Daedaleopsis nitida]